MFMAVKAFIFKVVIIWTWGYAIKPKGYDTSPKVQERHCYNVAVNDDGWHANRVQTVVIKYKIVLNLIHLKYDCMSCWLQFDHLKIFVPPDSTDDIICPEPHWLESWGIPILFQMINI